MSAPVPGPHSVECRMVDHPEDRTPAVLIQLPNGYVIVRPGVGKMIAEMIAKVSHEALAFYN